MQQYFITLLIFIPLLATCLGLFIPSSKTTAFKYLTLVVSVVQLSLLVLNGFAYSSSGDIQFIEKQTWITLQLGSWGVLKAEYFVGLDGLNA